MSQDKSPFPDPTEDEIRHMERLARRVASRLLFPSDDKEACVEDFMGAGWVAFYRHYSYEKRWRKVYDAMREAWHCWRFGVTFRSRAERRERSWVLVGWEDDIHGVATSEEEEREARDLLRALHLRIAGNGHYHGLFPALKGIEFHGGGPLTEEDRKTCGLRTSQSFYLKRQVLKRITQELTL